MQIGSFVSPAQVDSIASAGADYAELFVTRTLTPLTGGEFDLLARSAEAWPIRPQAFSGLVPADLRVTGPGVDASRQLDYLNGVFARIRKLNNDDVVVVFGSGTARSIPEGFSRNLALDQLEDFLRRASALAVEYGMTFALESLNRRESNVCNTLQESGSFIRQRELSDVYLLADLYHLMEEDEPMSSVDEFADLIVHTHIADTGRAAPGSGSYPLVQFFSALRKNGYRGRCSIECNWDDLDAQIESALTYCREALVEAGW